MKEETAGEIQNLDLLTDRFCSHAPTFLAPDRSVEPSMSVPRTSALAPPSARFDSLARMQDLHSWLIVGMPLAETATTRHAPRARSDHVCTSRVLVPGARNRPIAREVPSLYGEAAPSAASRPPAGPVAQWLEPTAHNGLVAGSSPAGPTTGAVAEPCRKGGIRNESIPVLVSSAAAGSVLDCGAA